MVTLDSFELYSNPSEADTIRAKKNRLSEMSALQRFFFFRKFSFGPNFDHRKFFILLYRFNGAEEAVKWAARFYDSPLYRDYSIRV